MTNYKYCYLSQELFLKQVVFTAVEIYFAVILVAALHPRGIQKSRIQANVILKRH